MSDDTRTVRAEVANAAELAGMLRRHLANPNMDHVHLTRAACDMLATTLEAIPAYVLDDNPDSPGTIPKPPCDSKACRHMRELAEHALWQATTFEQEIGEDPGATRLATVLCESVEGLEAIMVIRAALQLLGGATLAILDSQHPGHFRAPRGKDEDSDTN